jgi:cardiolipin synthase (CMP-forming)
MRRGQLILKRLPISIPNILTILRILLTPLFLIVLLRHNYPLALAIFIVAGVSDALDGFVARYFNQRTALGAHLDPVADKLLLISAFVALAILETIPPWVAILVIARDVIIFMGIAIFTMTGITYQIAPSIVSKCTTTAQILLIILALFDPGRAVVPYLHAPMIWGAAALTIVSGLHYIYVGMTILQDPEDK